LQPRRFIRRLLPEHRRFRDHSQLKIFGRLLHDPNLWHLNRHSVAGAFAVGLFCAMLPMPFESVVAALGAIAFRVNLPISVVLVWVSNPLTWIPLYGTGYLLGAWILGLPAVPLEHVTLGYLLRQAVPLWVGSVALGAVLSALGYLTIQALWRFHVGRNWKLRTLRQRRRSGEAPGAEDD
jgi:uncharacterized protein (DUF2062 family)